MNNGTLKILVSLKAFEPWYIGYGAHGLLVYVDIYLTLNFPVSYQNYHQKPFGQAASEIELYIK